MEHFISSSLQQYVDQLKPNNDVKINKDGLVATSQNAKKYWSIQLLKDQDFKDPLEVAQNYFQWLAQASMNVIKVTCENHTYKLYIHLLPTPVLILTLSNLSNDKAVYNVTGGLLAKKNQAGTFVFSRSIEKKQDYVIALEQFEPKLPWLLYRVTQAPIHEWVMAKYQQK